MLKWFDTNYHYMVPEFNERTSFSLSATKVFDEFTEALHIGIKTKPVLLSPVTFLHLGKSKGTFNRFKLFPNLLPLFVEVVRKLVELGAEWIQIDEPILVLELTEDEKEAIKSTYDTLRASIPSHVKVILATYFDDLGTNLPFACDLAVDALHIDLTRGSHNLQQLSQLLNKGNKSLSLGCIDGRNIWKAHYSKILENIKPAIDALSPARIMLATSCSLIHSPISSSTENHLPEPIHKVISFAVEKLSELSTLKDLIQKQGTASCDTIIQENEMIWTNFFKLPQLNNTQVRDRLATLKPEDTKRKEVYSVRRESQQKVHKLPLFPTTTIGSLPQTTDTRQQRLKFKKGEITETDYNQFIKEKIREGIRLQEEIGLDVLVHGEFERNDMVEYFGEMLDGFVFTTNGWVQSFGSRYVKPPIIYGDVHRSRPMTVEWIKYASSLTDLPVKAMLTGPITTLQWSFVRIDQPRSQTAKQIALAIRDEVTDLEKVGVHFIQVDEPAFREGLPLKKNRWEDYLAWAGDAFKLAVCSVKNETQIHTHMCYGEFADIIQAIASLDADVISIESSRSQMKLLDTFAKYKYPNEIGPGVFDIHSPRIPSVEEIVLLLTKAKEVISENQLWVNPDCGLKTRQYSEVKSALTNMVKAAKIMRREFSK